MKDFLHAEKSFLFPAVFLSLIIHVICILATGSFPFLPQVSVLQAQNSPEITVIAHPIVTVVEEDIVSEEIDEPQVLDKIFLSAKKQKISPEKNQELSVASLESRGAMTKAKPLSHINPAPSYPRLARLRGWEGTVRLKVLVDKKGDSVQVDIMESSGHEILDAAAVKTVKDWRFSPARSGTLQLSSKITIPIQFALVRE